MSTVVNFNNKTIIEPGVYAQTKSKVPVNPSDASYGGIAIIDNGLGAGFGGGSGILGEFSNGLDSVYAFKNPSDAKAFLRGGILYDLVDYLFNPAKGARGCETLYIVRAATTTPASATYTFTGGDADGGVFKYKTKNEGAGSNGVIYGINGTANAKVATGFGSKMKPGIIDPSKFIMEFYEGTYRGVDSDGNDFNGVPRIDTKHILVAKSPEFITLGELITWAKNDYSFNQRFVVDEVASVISGSGYIDSSDLGGGNSAIKVTSGGTTTYSPQALDNVLGSISELDNTFFLCDKFGDQAQSVENTKILNHILNDSEFEKFMVVGGGIDETKFTGTNGSIETAKFFDDAAVITVHSGFKVPKIVGSGTKKLSALYYAACVAGRIAGLPPQTPATFKSLRAKNMNHNMTKTQREIALQAGVLHSRFVPQIGTVINQSINSLQNNTSQILPNGKSFEISVMRIGAQLNKELTLNLRPVFVGGNLNSSSPADVKAFVEGYLTSKLATKQDDNLIIRFEGVKITVVEGDYHIEYGYVPNGPVNKLFVTSFILDGNLSA